MSANFISYYTKNKKTVTVREATILDAERMLYAGSKALRNAPYMLSTAEDMQNVTVEDMKKLLKTYVQNPSYVQFIAEVDGELVGAIEFKSGDKEKISHQGSFGMTVLPEYRNYGIGRALLETLINWAKNNSRIEKVCLEVMEGNIGAIKLYKTMGFVEEGRKIKGVKLEDSYQDLILMAIFV
jgi:ribosomal protein S18 acetylase RimI-like enzyme